MKKVINILVSIVFLLSFVGVQVHKHYSNGKLYSIAVYQEAESCCQDMEHCEMANMASCHHQQTNDCSCEDETEVFQLINNFVVSEKQEIAEMPVFDVATTCCSQTNIQKEYLSLNIRVIDILPPGNSLDTQSEFGVFLC